MRKGMIPAALVAAVCVAGAVAAASCSPTDPYGPPLQANCETKTITLTVTVYPNAYEIQEARNAIEPGAPLVDAFATYHPREDRHELHVLSPRGRHDDEWFYLWGHELAHSICGDWHPKGEER